MATRTTQGTHYFAVLDALGPPAQITELSSGFAFLYESISVRDTQIGVSPRTENFLSLLKLSYGWAYAKRDIFVVQFDDFGVASGAAIFSRDEKIGSSFTVQAIFGVSPSVDTSHLQAPPVQLAWGVGALRSLPETLNAQTDLTSGVAGLELIGTPTHIGQRTLEMDDGEGKK